MQSHITDAANSRLLLLSLASEIVAAYLRRNRVASADLATLIQTSFAALRSLGDDHTSVQIETPRPAVPIGKSVMPDYLICLEDGQRLKMLKRYLRRVYKMTPDEYRAKWKLASDYPMTAPAYAARRSDIAKETGLGFSRENRRKGPRARG